MTDTRESRPSLLRADLVPAATVQSVTGIRRNRIRQLAVGGDFFHPGYEWVWNFATRPDGEQDLRYWAREVVAPETCAGLDLGDVLAIILPPSRRNFPAGEVMKMFTLTPSALMRLRWQLGGRLQSSGSFYDRDGLEHFLRTRWVGVQLSKLSAPANGTSRSKTDKPRLSETAAIEESVATLPARRTFKP